MVFPEERELQESGETLPGERPVDTGGTPEVAAPADQKIQELEQQLEQLRQLKAGEQAERLRDLQADQAEFAERKQEQTEYAAEAAAAARVSGVPGPTPEAASATAASQANQISATALLGTDPQNAVTTLVQLATSSTSGFEKAVRLVREIAAAQGGAWILDEFHKRMVKGDAPGART